MTLKDTITRLFRHPTPTGDAAAGDVPAQDAAVTAAAEAEPTQETAPASEANAGSDATASPDAGSTSAGAPAAEREA
jgi:hypothetical protein